MISKKEQNGGYWYTWTPSASVPGDAISLPTENTMTTVTMEAAQAYITKHNLKEHFEAALQHVVALQPEDPLKEVARFLTEDRQQVKNWDMGIVFANFDSDGDGKLDITEFARAFRALGLCVPISAEPGCSARTVLPFRGRLSVSPPRAHHPPSAATQAKARRREARDRPGDLQVV